MKNHAFWLVLLTICLSSFRCQADKASVEDMIGASDFLNLKKSLERLYPLDGCVKKRLFRLAEDVVQTRQEAVGFLKNPEDNKSILAGGLMAALTVLLATGVEIPVLNVSVRVNTAMRIWATSFASALAAYLLNSGLTSRSAKAHLIAARKIREEIEFVQDKGSKPQKLKV